MVFPQYLEKNGDSALGELKGKEVFIVQKCMKVVTSDIPKLLNQKGCDASNAFDEEIRKEEQEFSDDELEQRIKREKKEARRNKHLEDGELPINKKRKKKTYSNAGYEGNEQMNF
mmetsp:Transcript_27256/g.26303  ORF Transcript_27256/g.26303 Transcript_27256/m.26303 type:complete len:115 (+) Transcript_27256:535-879(+)